MTQHDDIQLADMLESFPSAMTPGFQTLISAKQEFRELASDVSERLPPGRGQTFKHQKFYRRYLRDYKDLIILDETGTGKSCSVLNFTEYTRKELAKAKINPNTADEKAGNFKQVIVLVKGTTQKNEFRNQLVCKCSDGSYETGIVRRAKTETVQKSNVTLEIKRAGYRISTYGTFANRIKRDFYDKFPEEEAHARIIEEYSDTIFWIDEAHNLLIDTFSKKKKTEKEQTYHTLWTVLHLALRSKVILTTATPMINDEKELGSLLNLILPLNGNMPLDYDYRNAPPRDRRAFFPNLPPNIDLATAPREVVEPYFRGQIPNDFDFDNATIEDTEPYFRGRIGFIRAADTGAEIVEQGVLQEGSYEVNGVVYQTQLKLYATKMSEFQANSYQQAKASGKGVDELRREERQASNFIFPDGNWGSGMTIEERKALKATRDAKKAIKEAIEARGQNPENVPIVQQVVPETGIIPSYPRTVEPNPTVGVEEAVYEQRGFRKYVTVQGDNYIPSPEFKAWLENIEYIRTLSCKYAEIIRLVLTETEPGNIFIYGEYVEGSGSIVLSLCFEGMGFERYNESGSLFTGLVGDGLKPYCATGIDGRIQSTLRRPRLEPKLRYVILTGDVSESKFHSMMEAMNSYENRHGDYIKVFITSRVGRDGINVNNVKQIHLTGPEWNQSVMYQALSRGIRATSHVDLLQEEKERIMREEPGRDPETARVTVKVFKHAAIDPTAPDDSIDMYMYRFSESKERGIRRYMRMMKRCAIGCQIHYNRNVRPTDVDGSPECDYDICQYECFDPPPLEVDYSTYDILYSDDVVNEVMLGIINIYRHRNALTLDDISTYLPNYRRKYIIMALEKLITTKIPFTDRFGYTSYLREDKNSFYLDRTYPTTQHGSYAMSYYTQGIIGIKEDTLANIVVKLDTGLFIETRERLEALDPESDRFNEILNDMSIEGQVYILEDALLRYINGETSDYIQAIRAKYDHMIFPMYEQVTEMEKLRRQLEDTRPKRGRKPNPNTKKKVKKINPLIDNKDKVVRDTTGNEVILHILYTQVNNQTNYATTARYNKADGRIRLLKHSEAHNGWRDLEEKVEYPVYNAFIQMDIVDNNDHFEQHNVYGLILPGDHKFRIRNKLLEKECAVNDNRCYKRGLVCNITNKDILRDIMYEVGIPEPNGIFPDFTEDNREFLMTHIRSKIHTLSIEKLATWSLEKLVWYYKWLNIGKFTRDMMCVLIEQKMRELGIVKE